VFTVGRLPVRRCTRELGDVGVAPRRRSFPDPALKLPTVFGNDLKNINAFSYEEVLSQALNTTPGQQAFVNFVRQNQRTVRSALGGG
jgi:hypothetical protein